MNAFFRKLRKENIKNTGKYLLYALGEILLIIIGILIAVNINERQTTLKNNNLSCEYLEELYFSINHDIEDVVENIGLFERRNPHLKEILDSIKSQSLRGVDSIMFKINTLNKYVYFVQQSKSKIEELKYSNVNLITNRTLKNRILFYQESEVNTLLNQEERFNKIHAKVRNYFDSKFGHVVLEELESDRHFLLVTSQKYDASEGMKENYEHLLQELIEIKSLIDIELSEKCNK